MIKSQHPPDDAWLRSAVTPSFLSTILSKTKRQDLESNVHNYSAELLHKGTRSEVYALTFPKGSSPSSSDLTVILKRYLSPSESVQMRPGLAPPSDEYKPTYQHEYMNLLHFSTFVPRSVRPYLHDPEKHVVVMEALKGGDFDTRLNGFYEDYQRVKKDRTEIKEQIVREVDTVLSRAHETMSKATQFEFGNLGRGLLILSSYEKPELYELLNSKISALHSAGSNMILAAFANHKSERVIQSQLTHVADSNRLLDWSQRYVFVSERHKLVDNLLKLEGVIHRDLRPENVLIRSSSPSLETVLGDLTEIGWGPVDQDMVTFLMDSRLKKMFSLAERRAIYDRHLENELLPNYPIAQEFQTPKDRTLRFSIAAINALLSDIRFTLTYPHQADPARSLATGGNLEAISNTRRLPLPDIRDHFATQFLSLAQVLSTVQEEFPQLYRGVMSFYPQERRKVLYDAISDEDEKRHSSVIGALIKLFGEGGRLRQRYLAFGFL